MRLALMTDNKIESSLKFLNSGMSPRDLAKNLGGTPTLYRCIFVTKKILGVRFFPFSPVVPITPHITKTLPPYHQALF
jgi:hypothetical protein